MEEALARLGTPEARIVVGHSYGGIMAVLQAHLDRGRGRVRGLVLVDPMNPRFVAATGDFVQSTVPHIEHPATARDSATARLVATFDALVRDPDAGDAGLTMPIVIITAGEAWWRKPAIDSAWRSAHAAMAAAAPHRRLVVADSATHEIPARRPDTIVDAVVSLAGPK